MFISKAIHFTAWKRWLLQHLEQPLLQTRILKTLYISNRCGELAWTIQGGPVIALTSLDTQVSAQLCRFGRIHCSVPARWLRVSTETLVTYVRAVWSWTPPCRAADELIDAEEREPRAGWVTNSWCMSNDSCAERYLHSHAWPQLLQVECLLCLQRSVSVFY